MFANTFQHGFLSLFFSVGSNPLSLWDKNVKNGHIRRVIDEEVKSLVLELSGTNVATTYITCPIKPRASLGIKLPFLVMIVKNMKKYFTFEIQILDDKDMHRRFRVSNFQSTTKVRPFCTTMPIGLSSGWNQIQFNLADFTRRAYGSTYLETMRVQIHANVRIRRIYFSDRLYSEDEMPSEFKLFLPISKTKETARRPSKEEKKPAKEEPPLPPPEKVAPLQLEEEMPGAPPTPVEESPKEGEEIEKGGEKAAGEGAQEPPSESEATESPVAESPATEEESATTEMSEPVTPVEGEESSKADETSKIEEEASAPEETEDAGGEAAPASEADEAPPAETPAAEAPPAEEAPAEAPPVEEAPKEA